MLRTCRISHRIECHDNGAVAAHCKITVPLPASVLWGQVRGIRTFATHDLFHAKLIAEGDPSCAGTRIRIIHRFGFVQIARIGKILRWQEGREVVFSDLSQRGPHVGFPHIMRYCVTPQSEQSAVLTIAVRGKWTATGVPLSLRRLWVRSVQTISAARVVFYLDSFLAFRRARGLDGSRASCVSGTTG